MLNSSPERSGESGCASVRAWCSACSTAFFGGCGFFVKLFLASNYPLFILLGLGVLAAPLLGAGAFPAIFVVGLLTGLALAAHTLAYYARRTSALISFHDQDSQALPPKGTGLPLMDNLLEAASQKNAELQDTIKNLSQESEMLVERYKTLTDNLAAAIVIRDAEGRIAYCSPFTEVLTGYSLSEVYASQQDFFISIIHEEDRENYLRALKVTSFGEAFQFRYRFIHKTGIEMWAETRTVPISDESGTVTSSLSITLDITGIIRHQKQIEEKNRDLEDFSYMISHDLKAPIFTIKGMLSIIDEDFKDKLDGDFNETLTHIAKATKRLEELVTSVLEYSRIGTRENREEAVELESVIREIENEYAPQLGEAKAQLSFEKNLPLIVGDRLKVYQIFSNLVGNAIKYRCRERPLLINIAVRPSRSDRYARIGVKDNGLGIPRNKLEMIFRPFQRAHGKEIEGSGIGLACVKKLLEKLGGEIEVESEERVGSEFIVTLKLGRSAQAPSPGEEDLGEAILNESSPEVPQD